jgi:hypothetical protein
MDSPSARVRIGPLRKLRPTYDECPDQPCRGTSAGASIGLRLQRELLQYRTGCGRLPRRHKTNLRRGRKLRRTNAGLPRRAVRNPQDPTRRFGGDAASAPWRGSGVLAETRDGSCIAETAKSIPRERATAGVDVSSTVTGGTICPGGRGQGGRDPAHASPTDQKDTRVTAEISAPAVRPPPPAQQ